MLKNLLNEDEEVSQVGEIMQEITTDNGEKRSLVKLGVHRQT